MFSRIQFPIGTLLYRLRLPFQLITVLFLVLQIRLNNYRLRGSTQPFYQEDNTEKVSERATKAILKTQRSVANILKSSF